MEHELGPQEYIPELRQLALPVSFFALYWKPIAIVSIIAIAGLVFMYQKNRIDHFRNLYDSEKLVTEVLASNNVKLQRAIEDQNKSIKEAVDKSKKLDKALADLEVILAKMKIKAAKDKNSDLSRPAPKSNQEIIDLINETLRYMTWKE